METVFNKHPVDFIGYQLRVLKGHAPGVNPTSNRIPSLLG